MLRIPWSDKAEAGLVVSAGDDMALIRKEVQQGCAELYKCGSDGYLVIRYEADVRELVVVLGEGRCFKKWLPVIEDHARERGALTMRTHIKRPGLKKLYEDIGWHQQEIVMSKAL